MPLVAIQTTKNHFLIAHPAANPPCNPSSLPWPLQMPQISNPKLLVHCVKTAGVRLKLHSAMATGASMTAAATTVLADCKCMPLKTALANSIKLLLLLFH
jgi:hypothetical protein